MATPSLPPSIHSESRQPSGRRCAECNERIPDDRRVLHDHEARPLCVDCAFDDVPRTH